MPLRELLPSRTFAQFCVAGTLAFLVDAGLTLVLIRVGDCSPLIARIPAIAAAVVCGWLYNRHISFRERQSNNWLAELGRYGFGNSLGLCANYAAYALLVSQWPLSQQWPVLAVAAGAVAGLGVNYWLAQRMVFRAPD